MRRFLCCSAIFFLLGSRLLAGPDVEVRYARGEEVLQLPLIVNADEATGGKLYLSYAWAIQVEAIVCDGVTLPIANSGIIVDEEARYVVNFQASTYVYMCPAHGRFIYAKKLRGEGSSDDVVAINIPANWGSLEIQYKVRFADGPVSRTYHAKFARISLEETKRAQEHEQERNQNNH